MISSRAPGGREPRKHRKFEISKRVTIIRGDLEIEGFLQDISVGGAAIECSAALDAGLSDEIDIDLSRECCASDRQLIPQVYHYGCCAAVYVENSYR